jgi:hypothetical protein
MVGIMDKHDPCLDLGKAREKKIDIFPLLNPTLPYSNTPILQHPLTLHVQ